jgi:SAM-dependent methyltransferase
MHDSALDKARVFRSAYLAEVELTPLVMLDVGSAVAERNQKTNRDVMSNPRWRSLGIDIEPGPNVDIVVTAPYDWTEIATASVDVVTCSEVFEHAEFFWITMLEIARVLKSNGLAFITSPSSGPLHRFPVDCWRFYDDAFQALAKYAQLNLLESQVQWAPAYQKGLQWRDCSAVLQRPARSPTEEAVAFARIAVGKILARHNVQVDDFARLPLLTPEIDISPIGPMTGKHAFAKRESDLLKSGSSVRRKGHLILRHLREIGRILRSPLEEIRV